MRAIVWGSYVRRGLRWVAHCRRASIVLVWQLLLSIMPVFGGCSLAPFIATNSVDYNETVETVTNNVLVTNVLRARDAAPLYFSDLSQIRGSMQLSLAAQGSIPWGPHFNATTRRSVQGGPISLTSSPTFDIAPLNTKQFAQGMLDAIDVNIFSYFVQRGVDPRLLLNLLVSRVEVFDNNAGTYRLVETVRPEGHLFELIQSWTSDASRVPRMAISPRVSAVGPQTSGDRINPKDVLGTSLQANAAGLQLQQVGKNKYQLFKKSNQSVLCVPSDHGGFQAVGIVTPGATRALADTPVPSSDSACIKGLRARPASQRGPKARRYIIVLRSVEAVFYYLGSVLRNPERPPVPFYVYDHPTDHARFRVEYRGQSYYINEASADDYTITILAILNDLLNLNRDANEIPTTRAVQSVP